MIALSIFYDIIDYTNYCAFVVKKITFTAKTNYIA